MRVHAFALAIVGLIGISQTVAQAQQIQSTIYQTGNGAVEVIPANQLTEDEIRSFYNYQQPTSPASFTESKMSTAASTIPTVAPAVNPELFSPAAYNAASPVAEEASDEAAPKSTTNETRLPAILTLEPQARRYKTEQLDVGSSSAPTIVSEAIRPPKGTNASNTTNALNRENEPLPLAFGGQTRPDTTRTPEFRYPQTTANSRLPQSSLARSANSNNQTASQDSDGPEEVSPSEILREIEGADLPMENMPVLPVAQSDQAPQAHPMPQSQTYDAPPQSCRVGAPCGCGCDAVGPDPDCGCDSAGIDPGCGCEGTPCDPGCGCEGTPCDPGCGCDMAPADPQCGCDACSIADPCCDTGVISCGPSCGLDDGCGGLGCGIAAPSCGCGGCADGCADGCGAFGGGLLNSTPFQDFFAPRDGRWSAGIGFYFIKPHWETNPSFAVSTNNGGVNNQVSRQFAWDTTLAPTGYFAYTGNNGFGWQGRYTYFDESASDSYTVQANQFAFTPEPLAAMSLIAQPGEQINASHSLEFHVADLELSQAARIGCCALKGTFGGRYLMIGQSYQASVNSGPPQTMTSNHDFTGFGPTVSLETSRLVGTWKLFGNFRQSVMFGDRDSSVAVNLGGGQNSRTENNVAAVSMSEVEAGIRNDFRFNSYNPFVEVSAVGQYWSGVGNGANANLYSAQRDQAMGLIGGRASFGLTW